MKILKKILSFSLILSVLLVDSGIKAFAIYLPVSETPKIEVVSTNGKQVFPIDGSDKYSVNINWSESTFPNVSNINGKFINIYKKEHNKGYKLPEARKIYKNGKVFEDNQTDVTDLKSGTVYEIDVTSYYSVLEEEKTYSSLESSPSQKQKVLTDINMVAMPISTEKIKVVWDDVWYNGKRIDYNLYVSESPSFTLQPIRIYANSDIGALKKVQVNETEGKLEYNHTVSKSGSVYYFKIEPVIVDTGIIKNSGGRTSQVSSYIFVSTRKISNNEAGEVWNMEWSPIDVGVGNVDISYSIFKGINGGLASFYESTTNTNSQVLISKQEDNIYFYIKAIIKKDGVDLFPVEIRSFDVFLKEDEAPYTPAMPELVDVIGWITYENSLKSDSATIYWRAPKKGDGSLDADIKYDIWLVSNPDYIDNPPLSNKLIENYTVPVGDYIMDGTKTIGFKYILNGITPNSVYYFKIYARKQFNTIVDGTLAVENKFSEPAIKVIITPSAGNIDTPPFPNQPPFRVKTKIDGSTHIFENSVVLQMKNKWYEYFNGEESTWKYIDFPMDFADYQLPVVKNVSYSSVINTVYDMSVIDDVYFRKVEYDPGVTIDVGCEEIVDGISLLGMKELMKNANYKIKDVVAVPNDLEEDPAKNFDAKKHNIDLNVEGLKANSLYMFWLRVARKTKDLTSELSDPIIVSTLPKVTEEAAIPSIPNFRVVTGDIYMDVVCDFKEGYEYELEISKIDDIDKSIISKSFKVGDTKHLLNYRVEGLEAGSNYYVWLQAKRTIESRVRYSGWSDSVSAITEALNPPLTPSGFGIKPGGVTSSAVVFNWTAENNTMEYIIEYSTSEAFEEPVNINVGAAQEYILEGLLANKKYSARLYAFDKSRGVKSEPTKSVNFRTEKSDKEFDTISDEIEEPLDVYVDDFDKKNQLLKISIMDGSADTMIRKMYSDQQNSIKINLEQYKNKANNTNLILSREVVNAMNTYKDELIVDNGDIEIVIKPLLLQNIEEVKKIKDKTKVTYQIHIEKINNKSILPEDIKIKAGPFNVSITVTDQDKEYSVKEFDVNMKINTYYDDIKWYDDELTSVLIYNNTKNKWERTVGNNGYDEEKRSGVYSFNMNSPGMFVVGDKEEEYFEDIGVNIYNNEMEKVFKKYKFDNIQESDFLPDEKLNISDAIMFIFNILSIKLDSNYMETAFKGGLIDIDQLNDRKRLITQGEALKMVMRMYEIKTFEKFANEEQKNIFENKNYKELIEDKNQIITRGKMIVLIEKTLVACGDLE